VTVGCFGGTRGDMVQGSEIFEIFKKKFFCTFDYRFLGTPITDVGHKERALKASVLYLMTPSSRNWLRYEGGLCLSKKFLPGGTLECFLLIIINMFM